MPSPFPGMDPWLESPAIFPDLHDSLIFLLREAIDAALPKPYFATIANRIYVEASRRLIEPDINVLRPPSNGPTAPPAWELSGATPVVVHVPGFEITEQLLEIHATPDGERLVTTVEILSRANKAKRATGRHLYRKKQRELAKRRVNLVEFDLLRFGSHTTAVPRERAVRTIGAYDYHVCVVRARRPEDFEVYPIRLADRLPRIAIPLLKGVADVGIETQPLLDRCYDSGLFDRRTTYTNPCTPPLIPDQQAWADTILRENSVLPPA